LEFVIIDDGSTDDSLNIIKSYNDNRIRLIENKENQGQSKTLNKGINLARGAYIARVDQDDISRSDRLEKQLEFMEINSDIDVCGSWVELMGKHNDVMNLETQSEDIKISLLTNQNLAHPAVMIRKSALIKHNLCYDPKFIIANDYDLWVRMFEYCSFANIPEPLVKHRVHHDQFSKKFGEKNSYETNRILKFLIKKIGVKTNDSSLIIHKKVFYGYDYEDLVISEVFKYLRKLRSSNIRNRIFEPDIFNEFLRLKWRRFMLSQNHKLLYWVLTLLFFPTAHIFRKEK
jgi:Predicted glycosyltransferases